MWARATPWPRRSSCRRDGPRLLYTPRGLINRFICFLSYEPRCGPRDRLFTDLENLRRAARVGVSKKQILGGLRLPLEGLDATAAPRERWLRQPRSPETLDASSASHSRAARGGAIADGLATAQTRPGRPGGSVRLGLAPPRHPFVGCRRSVKRAASLPKSRCAPHRESPRRAARPDGSSTGRQLRTRHKNSDTHGQLHGQPWPTIE